MPAPEKNSRLFVKSYFASTIEDAMEQARVELGPEALLLNTREAPPEGRHRGEYEAVFGCRQAAGSSSTALVPVNDPVEDLRKRMEEIREMVARMNPAHAAARAGSVADALVGAGMAPALAVAIDVAVQQRLRSQSVMQLGRVRPITEWDPATVLRETVQELESRFEVAPAIGRITAVVGPPGSGKTTALVKLAVAKGLSERRQVRIISTDHYRIAAAAQLETYAEILGVPFILAETTAALAHAIDSAPEDALLFIDTPGFTAASLRELGGDLADFIRSRQEIDTHLILTAAMRPSDLRRIVELFEEFRPAKLFFSHLDETDSSAPILSEAARSGIPLSFFSTGQLIPEDLEPASKARVIQLLVRELPQPCEAVA